MQMNKMSSWPRGNCLLLEARGEMQVLLNWVLKRMVSALSAMRGSAGGIHLGLEIVRKALWEK